MDNAIYKSYIYNKNTPFLYGFKKVNPTFNNDEIGMYWHRDIELIYVISGEARITLDIKTYTINKGNIVVINSNAFHKIITDNTCEIFYIIASTIYLQDLFTLNISKTSFNEYLPDNMKLKILFEDLMKENESSHMATNIMQDILTKAIFIELYRHHAVFGSLDKTIENGYMNDVLRIIDEHFLEDITIDDICAQIHFTKSYLCTKFKRYTGMTVRTYINHLRIHHAKELILQKNYTVARAAEESGYNNIPYFTRTFKKIMGSTPSDFIASYTLNNNKVSNKFGKWPKKTERTYYQSVVGADFCVTWTEEGALTHDHWYDVNHNRLKPVENGYYSSGDEKYLSKLFARLKEIGIDYLLLEDTNGHWNDLGYIARNISNCFKTADNQRDRAPFLAITSGLSLKEGDIKSQRNEMDIIYYEYVNKYPSVYFQWENKPLLVLMISNAYDMINVIHDPRFTLRYGTGLVGQQDEILSCTEKYEDKYKYLQEKGNWARVFDKQNNKSELLGVQPGYNPMHKGKDKFYIERRNGAHYIELWLSAIKANPKTILISSYNSFEDETSIEAAIPIRPSTQDIPFMYDEDPFLYEKITDAYLALKYGFIEGFFYRKEHDDKVYQFTGKELKIVEETDKEPVILIPDDYLDWYNVKKGQAT